MNDTIKVKGLIDKAIQYLYYCLFAVTPLIMTSITSELFEFNKMIFIYLITSLITFLWLLKIILTKKIFIQKTPFDIPIVLFFISQVLSTLFSIDPHTSLFGYYGRFNGGLISIIAYLLLFYGFVSNIDFGIETVNKILKISLFVSFLVILWGLPGRLGRDLSCLLFMGQFNNNCWTDQFRPSERMFSTLGQPNWLGAYLAINFFIGFYFLLKEFLTQLKGEEGWVRRWGNIKYLIFCTSYLVLNFSTILFTRSRSALLAVIVGFGVIVVFLAFLLTDKWRENFSNIKKPVLAFILLVFILPILFFKTGVQKFDQFITPQYYVSLVKKKLTANVRQTAKAKGQTKVAPSDYNVTESGDIRKIVWEGAIKLGKKYPILGSGVETFAYSYYFVRPKAHNLTSEWDYLYNKAHNEYLNYLATTGFVGLGCYLLLIGSVLYFCLTKLKNLSTSAILQLSLLLAMMAILITNFFGFSTSVINLYLYLIPAMLFLVADKKEKGVWVKNFELSIARFRMTLIIISLLTVSTLIYLFSYFLADVTYAKAENFSKLGDYQTAANLLERALKLKYEHVYEDRLSYILANLAFIASYQKEEDAAKKFIILSKTYNEKSLKASPKNILYWKTKAKNEYLFYQVTLDAKYLAEGIKTLSQAKILSPTDPKIPYTLTIFYSLLEDETKDKTQKNNYEVLSLKAIDETINLKPNYRDGYFLKGQLLKKYNQNEEAKAQFEYILKNINSEDSESINELKEL